MAITTSNRRTLFDGAGVGDEFVVPHYAKRLLSVLGTFGAAVKLQVAVAFNEAGAVEWQDFPSASWAADAIVVLDIPAGKYRWWAAAVTAVAASMGE